jgi:hypothetical protein
MVLPVSSGDLPLLDLLRSDWEVRAPQAAMSAPDWTDVVRKALHHGVAGLLCRALRRLPDADVPRDVIEAAQDFQLRAVADGAERVDETLDVLEALAADGVSALAFKGVALAMLAHADPCVRPSKDIDVLVPRGDMARAVASLGALGYRLGERFSDRIMDACFTTYGQEIVFAQGRLPVEPHWTFAPSPFAIDLDLDGMWRRAITIDIAGRQVRTLSIEDTLLVACLHGAKEKWWRLLWVADIAALVHRHPAIDWAAVEHRAARAGMVRILRLGLGLAHALFSTRLPGDLTRAIERDAATQRLIEASRRRLASDAHGPEPIFRVTRYHWNARERIRDRVRYVWRTITTPHCTHYRMVALPDALAFGYVPIKIVHDYLLLPLWQLGRGRLWRRARTPIPVDAP